MLNFGLLKKSSLRLPRAGLLLHAKRFDPTILKFADKMGDSRRTVQPLQFCQCDGTGYFAGTLTGSETVTSKQGTATVTFASGRMNVGAGTLWSITLSNGSRYEFATKTGTTSALLMDVSGNGRHLVATSFADIAALCATSKTAGSDHLNQRGYSVNTTTYAPATVIIPALSSNPALDALGNAVQYPGRCKLDVIPVDANCSTWASGTSVAITGITGATILSKEGTAVVTIGTNVISYSSAGTLYNLKLTLTNGRVLTIPFSEGAGTTVLGYDDQGTVYTGTVTTSDLTAFWAGKQDTFFPGLQHGCSIGRWSPVDGVYKDEPTRTNKCRCVKANPTETTNISAPTGGTVSVVSATPAINAAGLSHICTSGNVYRFTDTLLKDLVVSGPAGNTNIHTVSVYVRVVSGTGGRVRLSGVRETLFTNTTFQRVTCTGVALTSSTLTIRNEAGAVIEFILPQLEEGSTATSPIIGADTAAAATEYNGIWPANPYTGLDCRGNALTSPPLKMNASASYKAPEAFQLFSALGESAWFNADGTAKTLTYAQVIAAADGSGDGDKAFFDPAGRGLAIYDTVQVDPALAKIKKYMRLS